MILVPPELWETRCQTPSAPPVKKVLKSKDHNYNKLTKVCLLQDPYLKTENQKRKPITFPIIETSSIKPSFKTKPKRQCIIGSVSLFKTESESETDISPMKSKCIQNELKRKVSHDPTFGVYQDDTDCSFKIGRSNFKYNDNHLFVDGRKYMAGQDLRELLTRSKPDKNVVTFQNRQAYKQIILQSNAHRVNYSPLGQIKVNRGLKLHGLFHSCLTTKKCLGNRYNNVSG